MPSFCLVALCYFKTSWKWSHDSMTSSLTEVLALSFIGIQSPAANSCSDFRVAIPSLICKVVCIKIDLVA